MSKKISLASFILRLGLGSMMLTHGWSKFLKVVNGNLNFANPLGFGEVPTLFFAVLGEFICPILLIIGFRSKLAAVPPAITMFVAAIIHHADDPWKKQEFPLLYFFGFLAIYILGSGRFSLDNLLKRR